MKIQCDVCSREEASVFCSADEAALCDGCDGTVHHANKLAGKHRRFSLLHPSSKDAPCCDVCQERRAFLFCREDRAILCRECDISIHTANELTKNHSRFLLTGVRLSSPPTCATIEASTVPEKKTTTSPEKDLPVESWVSKAGVTQEVSTSSISEYLTKTLPGWHVEDLLNSYASDGLYEVDDLLPFSEADFQNNLGYVLEDNPICVPQVPQISYSSPYPAGDLCHELGRKESKDVSNPKRGRARRDDGFTVPQMNPPSKRSRSLWQIS